MSVLDRPGSRYPTPQPGIRHRLFIVGAPRSGTTVLQGLVAAHPCLHTFPETGLLLKAFGMRRGLLPWLRLGITLGGEWRAMQSLLARMERAELCRDLPGPGIHPIRRSVAGAAGVLDALALEAGCDGWVEKTPRHYLHADLLPELVPSAQVIHILRDGCEVVASIHHRARQYPERFRRQRHVGYGIHTWNRAVAAHLRVAGRPGHHLILYDDLVREPAQLLSALCQRLGLEWHPGMLHPDADDGHILPREHWKRGAAGAVRAPTERFSQLFCADQRRKIRSRLNYGSFERLLAIRLQPSPAPG